MHASVALLAVTLVVQHPQGQAHTPTDTVALYGDLGDHHHRVTTDVPAAQAYFDQGLRLYYGFNHAEAIRSFQEAQRRDSTCAMCWWGEALSWGPNINMPMDEAGAVAARRAMDGALRHRDGSSALERDLIDALDRRYAASPPGDRAALDSAYAHAMEAVAEAYPDDDDVQVLYAESLMDLRPWDYWTEEGAAAPGMEEALDHLTEVTERSREHPGACHFYIHAVEEVYPERAVACAERLAALMPGAGHIQHMPGHIYVRVGRWEDAVKVNEHATHADETWMADQRPGTTVYTAGYYPHNYDFMAFAAAMAGMEDRAVHAADKVAELVPEEMVRAPGMGFLQNYLTRPYQVAVGLRRWDRIEGFEEPAEDFAYTRAVWHYARGRAELAQGHTDAARAHLDDLRALAADEALTTLRMEFNDPTELVAIAEHVLAGWIAHAENDAERAVRALERAAEVEDDLLYGEPPEWTVPVRQELGALLLELGRPEAAARAFTEDLERFPENARSLAGLADARIAAGRGS